MSGTTLYPDLIKQAQKENPFAKLGEIVYQILETQILSLTLQPGSKLRINSIAEDLNISATPVREAIDMLEDGELCSTYYHSREEAIERLRDLPDDAVLRATTLEDVFVERLGHRLTHA